MLLEIEHYNDLHAEINKIIGCIKIYHKIGEVGWPEVIRAHTLESKLEPSSHKNASPAELPAVPFSCQSVCTGTPSSNAVLGKASARRGRYCWEPPAPSAGKRRKRKSLLLPSAITFRDLLFVRPFLSRHPLPLHLLSLHPVSLGILQLRGAAKQALRREERGLSATGRHQGGLWP